MWSKIKKAAASLVRWAASQEPLVTLNAVAGVAVGFAEFANGELGTEDSWPALAWAVLVYFGRDMVFSPATVKRLRRQSASGE